MESKETKVTELFFQEPTRQWHFEEILKEAGITRSKASIWLSKLGKERIIKRIKERGRMPYYTGNYENPAYQNRKKLYAMEMLYECGLLNHLASLEKANTVILFGSLARWDWYSKSDIDIFIYGEPEGLSIAKYEIKAKREIQLFICRNKKELKKLGNGLLRNIIKGIVIKGDLGFVEVGINT
ncbi:MAG: nucleotidyltransferase domain-containing protein [Nanoarchaeota archaeon]|nr:nucleotidyltransferase domain-containing protein [Nanoarchaeota archaeon]